MRIARIVPETAAVTSVYLAADDGRPLPLPSAGQYLTLRLAGAADPAPVRSYSISSGPAADGYRISVKREGVASAFVHDGLLAGATIDVAAPRGEFVMAAEDARPVVLLSAGIGVTPVLATPSAGS
jgi:ferredoxin-NADP reductase